MSPYHYCPRCSAYLGGGDLDTCPRCGSDLGMEKERKDRIEAELKRKNETVQGPFHPVLGRVCPICGEEVEILSSSVEEFTVYGSNCGKGPLGEMKAPTQVFVGFRSWRCRKMHKLFSSFEVESRENCPKCLIPNNLYGKLVRSCPKCRMMVPVDYYVYGDPVELMSKRGYKYAPELE